MTQKQTRAWLVAVLVVAAGVAAYAWFGRGDAAQEDKAIAGVKQTYVCASCGEKFDLTVAEAASMRQSRGDVFCPKCGQPGAQKEGVIVRVSGMAGPVNRAAPPTEQTVEVQTPEGKKQISAPGGGLVAPKGGS